MITAPNDLLAISQLRAELKAVKAEHYRVSEDGRQLYLIIAGIAESLGIYGSAPYLCQATGTAVKKLTKERDALRDALQFIANHEAPEGSALETVVRFARLAIEVKE